MKIRILKIIYMLITFVIFGHYTHCFSQSYWNENENYISLGNNYLEIVFNKSDNGGIYSLIDKLSGLDFRQNKQIRSRLFGIEFVNQNNEEIFTDNFNNPEFSYKVDTLQNGLRLRIINKKVYNQEIDVHSIIDLENHSTKLKFRVEINNNYNYTLRKIRFPIINGFAGIGQNTSDDYLFWPDVDGLLITDPYHAIQNIGGFYMRYPWRISMQYFGFYDSDCGYYFFTKDSLRNTKIFFFEPGEMSVQILHPVEETIGNSYKKDFDTILGVFHGDWYDLADIYKSWTRKQSWCNKTLLQRSDIPDWFKEVTSILFTTNYNWNNNELQNSFEDIGRFTLELQKSFNQRFIADVSGFEREGVWVYPFVFPPREGDDKLNMLTNLLHNNYSNIQLPIIGCHWVTSTGNYESIGRPLTVMDENGNRVITDAFPPYKQGLMCVYTEEWKNIVLNEVREAALRGVDLIQIDQYPKVHGCYDPNHGHSIGMAGWWQKSVIQTLEEAKNIAKVINPNCVLMTEEINEIYLPYVQTYFARAGMVESFYYGLFENPNVRAIGVPAFEYIYHPYLHGIGSGGPLDLRQWDEHGKQNFFLVMARELVYGNTCNFQLFDDTNLEYVDSVHLSNFKKILHAMSDYGHEFIYYGDMLRPPKINVPQISMMNLWKNYLIETPAVIHSAWKSPYNKIGYFLVNISNELQNFDLNISSYDLPIGSALIYMVKNGHYSVLHESLNLPTSVNLQMAPQDVIMIGVVQSLADSVDLSISSSDISFSPSKFNIGQIINANVIVHNNGISPVHPVTVQFYVGHPDSGGTLIGVEKTIPEIDAGSQKIIGVMHWINEPEDLEIYAKIDASNLIPEYNENNNIAHSNPMENTSPPIILDYSPKSDTSIVEGDTLEIFIRAYDPDDNPIFFKWIVNGKQDTTNFDSTFQILTNFVSAGVDTIIVTISDGKFTKEHKWIIKIENANVPSIIFDETHGELSTISIDRALELSPENPSWPLWSNFKNDILKKYEIFGLYNANISTSILDSAHVVIISTPTFPLSAQEELSLKNFIFDGGNILILSDVFTPPVNNFTAQFGITFDNYQLIDETISDGYFWVKTLDSLHSITQNLDSLMFSWGTSLSLSEQALPLAYTPSTIFRDIDGDWQKDANEPYGPFIIMADSEYGEGRIVCISDNSFDDFAWISWGNSNLMMEILEWLTEKYVPTNLTLNISNNPKVFQISQNYPNPFNSTTKIKYQLPNLSDVKIEIYNLLGQKIKTLINRSQSSGYYTFFWDGRNDIGSNVSSGIYFIRMEAGQFIQTKKALLLK